MLKPFERMLQRIDLDRQDSPKSHFDSLMYGHEFLLRFIVAGIVAGIQDDPDRSKYRVEHRLVRSSGVGDWIDALHSAFTGPASQLMDDSTRAIRTEMTQRLAKDCWQYDAVRRFRESLLHVPAAATAVEDLPGKPSLMHWCRDFVVLRNKTRGHGAPSTHQLDSACPAAEAALKLILDNFSLLDRPWVFIRRNLNGKYRVSPFGDNAGSMAKLRSANDQSYADGVYVQLDVPRKVSLIVTDSDLSDFFVANGGFTESNFELLSYITGETPKTPSLPYLQSPDPLPASLTQGRSRLEEVGRAFTNLPRMLDGYVRRPQLEAHLTAQLESTHHPIVTLDGRGGIGKTSTALQVVTQLAHCEPTPFDIILWFSARDIDLEEDRPKQVRPSVSTVDGFARYYAALLELPGHTTSGFDARKHFGEALSGSSVGSRTLFVFDNFETVVSASEAYKWIDTYIRPPNKVLITTRIRGKFNADFQIHVGGMEQPECRALIQQTARRLQIYDRLDEEFTREVIDESGGHPYVIKVLLGERSRRPNVRKVERVIAAREDILDALFERTWESLSPAARRVFLTLCTWRSIVPELAVEAVIIRPGNERIDVGYAVDELVNSSFIDRLSGPDDEFFLLVPLAAHIFGRSKFHNDPYRGSIEEDSRLLRQFGAAQRHEISHGLESRLRIFFNNMQNLIESGSTTLEACRPVIEYVARKYPKAWLLLADLCGNDSDGSLTYLKRYLEHEGKRDSFAWKRLADIHRASGRGHDEVNALVQLIKVEGVPMYAMSNAVQRINNLLRVGRITFEGVDLERLLREVASVFLSRRDECNATDLSRLGWLYESLRDFSSVREVVELGLKIEPDNECCLKLQARLEQWT